MATAELMQVHNWESQNRNRLIEKRTELVSRIAAIDTALAVLDKNPEVERLADALKEAMRSDY